MLAAMTDDVARLTAALAPLFHELGVDDLHLTKLDAHGVSHDHFAVRGQPWLVRAPKLSQLDLGAEAQMALQVAAFERAAPSGASPRLIATAPVTQALPLGALIVERIEGAAPDGPTRLPAIARALAGIHALPLPEPDARPPIPEPTAPFKALAARAHATFEAYLPGAGLSRAATRIVQERMRWLSDFASQHVDPGPVTLCVTDAHPGNFVIRPDGRAVFVDLEKPAYNLPGLDLAHAVIAVAAGWDPTAGMQPDAAARDGFVKAWMAAVPAEIAERTAPLILAARQAVWLRTFGFFLRWRTESQADGPWSATRLGPGAAAHFRRHVEASLDDEAIRSAAEAWTA